MEQENLATEEPIEVVAVEKSPHDKYFDRMREFKKANQLIGQICIRGLSLGEDSTDEEEDEEEFEDTSAFTEEQMQSLRYVMLDQERSDCLDEMEKFVLQEQAGKELLGFDTCFSYQIRDNFFKEFKSSYLKIKQWDNKFNRLFTYTYNLMEYNVWMLDNEGDMGVMVNELAGLWKKLLKKPDKDLGIDTEYTRPAIMAFLEDFKEEVEASYSDPPLKFKFA